MDALDLFTILRLQIGCLCFSLLMAIPVFVKKWTADFAHGLFRALLIMQLISLTFDIITVYTVNNLETVPALLNKLCHVIFIAGLCLFIYLTFIYVRQLITKDNSKKRLFFYGIPAFLSVFIIAFAPLYYAETQWGNYSKGPGATVVYCIVGVYLIMMLYMVLRHWKIINNDTRRVILIALLTELIFSVTQLFIPTLLISGLGTSLITLAIYLTIENPDRILKDQYRMENIDLLDKVHYDALTGIYNRRFLEENLSGIVKTIAQCNGMLGVLMIDIDYFKKYNDTYGHGKGDECLKIIAGALNMSVTRNEDFVVRYGGEEFAVVLPSTDENGAQLLAGRILHNIRACNIPHSQNEAANCVTVSIGVTAGKVDYTKNKEDFINLADKALYQSKQSGRNRYSFVSFDLQ